MIYFDNAATTGKKPPAVVNAVRNALINYSANPGRSGHKASVKAAEEVYRVREKAANFFGATGAENVCFTMNCTHSINCVIKGVLRMGDRVLTSSLEHNAVMRPINKIGVGCDMAQVSLYDDNKTLEEFEGKIVPNTKLVICTGASNVLGKTLPIEKIGKICREKGVLFAVDAAQTAGVIPIDMKKMNIDFLCVAPHKGLYAPMGVGMLICEKNIYNTIIEGGTGTNSVELVQPETLPERLESGTLNLSAISGISAGIDYVNHLSVSKIFNHEAELIRHLYNGIRDNPNVLLYTPDPSVYSYAPVLSFNIKGLSSEETAKILDKNGIAVRSGLHCAPSAHKAIGTISLGTVRVSVATFNTKKEIDYLISIINSEKLFKRSKKTFYSIP